MSNFQTNDPGSFFRGLAKRVSRLENTLGVIGGKTSRAIVQSKQVFVGPTSPVPNLTVGTEYVWYVTNGSGVLVDTIVGIA